MMLTPEEWEAVALSVRVATLAVGLSLAPGVLLAYGLARRRLPAPLLVDYALQLPLVLPPVATGLLLLWAVGPSTPVGRWLAAAGIEVAFAQGGAVLAAAVVSFPLLVQTLRVAFEQVDPEWEEAAAVYGASRWQAFRLVTLPLAARGVAAAVVLAFARALGEFGATIVVAGNLPGVTRTLPLALFTRLNQAGGEAGALRLLLVAVALAAASLVAHALLTRRLHRASGTVL